MFRQRSLTWTRLIKSMSPHDKFWRPISLLVFYLHLEGNSSIQVPTVRGWVSPRQSIHRSVWEGDHPETCPEWNMNRPFRNTPLHWLSCFGFMSDLKYGCLQRLELWTGLTCARHKRKYCFLLIIYAAECFSASQFFSVSFSFIVPLKLCCRCLPL
jgi:hypothetical protein